MWVFIWGKNKNQQINNKKCFFNFKFRIKKIYSAKMLQNSNIKYKIWFYIYLLREKTKKIQQITIGSKE